MKALLLALQLAALPASGPDDRRSSADRTWDQAERAMVVFLDEWADAWRATQAGAAAARGLDGLYRTAAVHCHWPPGAEDGFPEHTVLVGAVAIPGSSPAHLSCPTWYPATAGRVADERLGLDAALARTYRRNVRLHREELMRDLRAAARHSPEDVRLTGQLVRFALDGGDLDQAWKTAAACRADAVQCELLRGLVLYRRQAVAAADSVFLAASRAMPEPERCAWTDVGVLLEWDVRGPYKATSCADRAELETRLWWLADPLYHEPGNERRAEHFARKVMVALVAQLPSDGRQHFERHEGGEAVIETLIRYGWPAHVHWGGRESDNGHSEWLSQKGVATAAPYVAREYTRGRLHTLPATAALASPFSAAADRWQLNDPGTESLWWPVEHYARDRGGIVELDGQGGTLRRAQSTRLVWAGALDAARLARRGGTSVSGELFAWRSATDGRTVGTYQGSVGGKLFIDVPLEPGPALIGVEIPIEGEAPAARTRFGLTIDAPLASLPAAARALSQPLLFEPPSDEQDPVSAEVAVARMYPGTSFAPGSRIGVYWEGYGFAAADTVDVELRVTREERPGALAASGALASGRALAPNAAAGATPQGDQRTGASLRWRDEPGTARAIQASEGGTPVQLRNVMLDLSGLASGSYLLTVSMTGQRSGTVSSERRFVVR